MTMQLFLWTHSVLGILTFCCLTGILCSSNHYIDWNEASKQCKSKYDSELISQQYIAAENLTQEIVQELGFNIAAWIDGKVHEIGCRDDTGTCFRIKQMHTTTDRKMPHICVAIGAIDIGQEEVTYEKAQEMCERVKFKSNDAVSSKIAERVDMLYHKSATFWKSTTFWLPNIELEINKDITCTYVVSRDNETLETMYDNCTIPKMGVCINTTYIPDYQMTTILEITTIAAQVPEITETAAYEDMPSAQRQIFTESGNSNEWDWKTLLPFAFSGANLILFLTLMCVMVILWKRVTVFAEKTSPYTNHDAGRSQKKSKSKHRKFLRNIEYEGLPQNPSGNSTRVKMLPEMLPENDENPYSEISGKGASRVCDEMGAYGAPGYVDMRGMQSLGDPYSSFNIGKSSTKPINTRYVTHEDFI